MYISGHERCSRKRSVADGRIQGGLHLLYAPLVVLMYERANYKSTESDPFRPRLASDYNTTIPCTPPMSACTQKYCTYAQASETLVQLRLLQIILHNDIRPP